MDNGRQVLTLGGLAPDHTRGLGLCFAVDGCAG